LKKTEKTTTDATGESDLKEADPIEKAEKDFWKIIDDEKRKRDRKTALVCFLPNVNDPQKLIFFRRLTRKLRQRQQQQQTVTQRLTLKRPLHHKKLNSTLFYFKRNFHTLSVCLALISEYKNCLKKEFASFTDKISRIFKIKKNKSILLH
jgi:hypothetical protein